MTQLILKRASTSRPSDEWNDDDYDVLADGAVVGRIFKVSAAPGLPPAGSHQLCLAHSFNHLVSAGEQRGRHVEAERFRSLKVDCQFELRWLLNGKIARLRTAQNLVNQIGRLRASVSRQVCLDGT